MLEGDHDGNIADRSTAAKDPRASARARSNHASPGRCKASVLCISLWMLSANSLVTCCAAVDERGCGKVDNSSEASLAQVGKLPCPHPREASTVQPVSSVIRATDMAADLPLFRRNRTVHECRWTSPDGPSNCTDRRGASPCAARSLPPLGPPFGSPDRQADSPAESHRVT
jgi:hypothetical protein